MHKSLSIALALSLAPLVLAGCNSSGTAPAPSNSAPGAPSAKAPASGLSIAVIPKGTTHVYWKSVEAGSRKAGAELGVTINWKGPLNESDRASQIGIVENFTADNASAIVLAPLDDTALVRPVQAARAKKIPVVIMDSALKGTPGKDFSSIVATNNRAGGAIAGHEMVRLLGGKGKVAILRYEEGSASTGDREEGFLDVMKATPGIQVVLENRYGGATVDLAKTASLSLMDTLKTADGIYCPNESTTFGMLLALRQNNLAGKKKFVGFDTSPQLLEGLRKGEIDGLVAQNPVKMGYEAVKTAVAVIEGQKVPPVIDTGATLVTKATVDTPAIKKLLAGA